jgi:Fic family protein
MDQAQFGSDSPGSLTRISTSEGPHFAFVPDALPPTLDSEDLIDELARTASSVARLGAIAPRAGGSAVIAETFVRKEALDSNRIEGTQATLADLYAFEIGAEQLLENDPRSVKEVSNYVSAMEYGLFELDSEGVVTDELLCDMHALLLDDVRGGEKWPGTYRDQQNFIGETRSIRNSTYVPPPPEEVPERMSDLIEYANFETTPHELLRIGLVHYQLETIHPYMDGNGRLGRLLITLLLTFYGVLPGPYLYLSSYINANKNEYYDRLQAVRTDGEFEAWLRYFLRALDKQASEASELANDMLDLQEEYKERYIGAQRKGTWPLVETLFHNPYLSVNDGKDRIDVSYPTANRIVEDLESDDVLEELPRDGKTRIFRAREVYELINQSR